MQGTPIYQYFQFGYNYKILRHHMQGRNIRGAENSLESSIKEFLAVLSDLNLLVTEAAARGLQELLAEVQGMPEGAVVDRLLAERVTEAVDKLDTTLDAELTQREAFVVTPKRFDVEMLLRGPRKLLAPNTAEKMPAMARFDFASACRCIAFGLPTAAAFHLMRGVEGMLREYYCAVVKRNRCEPMNWGPMIQHLRKRRAPPPATMLDHLDHLRTNFRNPTQHPDARYDAEEAQDLLAVAVDTLNRLARAMPAT